MEVELAERNWYRLRAGTYVQGGESTMEAAGELLNATGRCEHLTASVEYGTEMSHTGTLSYSQPRILGKPIVVRGPRALTSCFGFVRLSRCRFT